LSGPIVAPLPLPAPWGKLPKTARQHVCPEPPSGAAPCGAARDCTPGLLRVPGVVRAGGPHVCAGDVRRAHRGLCPGTRLAARRCGRGAWVVCSGALLAALYLDYSAFYVYSALVIWFVVVGRRRAPTAPFMPTQACGMTNCVVWWWKVISRSDEPAGSAWMGHGKSDTSARTASAVASVSEGMTCRSNQPRNTPAADDKLGQLEDLERPVVLAGEDRSRGGRSGADPQGRGYLAGLTTMRSPSPARAPSRGSRTHTVFLRCSYDFL
jgi:hypothetical protein